MIRIVIPVLLIMILASGCDLQKRENTLNNKEAQLQEREQEIIFRERTVALREAELLQKEKRFDSLRFDSLRVDSVHLLNMQIADRWNVKMTCTETSCAGSAIGDTKIETWTFSNENNSILVKAMADDKLVRVYSGKFNGNQIELTDDATRSPAAPNTKMLVRLSLTDSTRMEGNREIIRENDCKILYSLQLTKL